MFQQIVLDLYYSYLYLTICYYILLLLFTSYYFLLLLTILVYSCVKFVIPGKILGDSKAIAS